LDDPLPTPEINKRPDLLEELYFSSGQIREVVKAGYRERRLAVLHFSQQFFKL